MEGRRLSRPGWLVTCRNKVPPRESNPDTVTQPSTNRAQCKITSLIETSVLPLRQTSTIIVWLTWNQPPVRAVEEWWWQKQILLCVWLLSAHCTSLHWFLVHSINTMYCLVDPGTHTSDHRVQRNNRRPLCPPKSKTFTSGLISFASAVIFSRCCDFCYHVRLFWSVDLDCDTFCTNSQ